MQTSGVVLDIYDDVGGEVLREMFPSQEKIPGFVKEAHALTPDERRGLPDDAYALVLVNGGEKLRKFACIDEGNTTLSILYFLKHAHKLPDEARSIAAENLKVACGWYGLDVPEELEKEAGVRRLDRLGKALDKAKGSEKYEAVSSAFNRALLKSHRRVDAALGKVHAHGANLDAARKELLSKTAGVDGALEKEAGLVGKAVGAAASHAAKNPVGTAMTAMTAPSLVRGTAGNISNNLQKVRAGEAVAGSRGGLAAMAGPRELEHVLKHGEVTGTSSMPVSADAKKTPSQPLTTIQKSAHLRPVVDVTNLAPQKEAMVKKAQHYALGKQYPLDTYTQVKMAASYFDEYGRKLSPEDRHTYCSNLVKRASELDTPVSPIVRKYGSEKYASSAEMRAAIDVRRQIIDYFDKEASDLLEEIWASREQVEPSEYAHLLGEFDKTAGIADLYDRDVMDPFYSTYGFEKDAEDEKKEFKDQIGIYHVTGEDLRRLALTPKNLKNVFGEDFVEEYRKDPISIYKSMPVDQKKLIIRMATENSPL